MFLRCWILSLVMGAAFGGCTESNGSTSSDWALQSSDDVPGAGYYVVCFSQACPVADVVIPGPFSLPVGRLMQGETHVGTVEVHDENMFFGSRVLVTPALDGVDNVGDALQVAATRLSETFGIPVANIPLELPLNTSGISKPSQAQGWYLVLIKAPLEPPLFVVGFSVAETQTWDAFLDWLPSSLFSRHRFSMVLNFDAGPLPNAETVAAPSTFDNLFASDPPQLSTLLVRNVFRDSDENFEWLMTRELIRLWIRNYGTVTLDDFPGAMRYMDEAFTLGPDGSYEACYPCFDKAIAGGFDCEGRDAAQRAIDISTVADDPDTEDAIIYLRSEVWWREREFIENALAFLFEDRELRMPLHRVYGGEPSEGAFAVGRYQWVDDDDAPCSATSRKAWLNSHLLNQN